MNIKKLYQVINDSALSMPEEVRNDFEKKFTYLINNSSVKELIEWEIPPVNNLTADLELDYGNISAVRLDLLREGIGLKKPVVGALLVKHLIHKLRSGKVPEGIIDGGNVNTGLALSFFANKFGIKATLIHSRFFPKYVKEFLKASSYGNLELREAPPTDDGREREFYRYLVEVVRKEYSRKGYMCLWHAKHSGKSLSPLGEQIASRISNCPDYIILSLGAGATLEGIALPIRKRFGNKPTIIIIEHSYSPILQRKEFTNLSYSFMSSHSFSHNWVSKPPKGIPHYVVGPHYDEINPLLSSSVLNEVDYVVRYTDEQWKWMASFCKEKGISIGNSSAANLLVSRAIAELGKSVLTFIYEPFRPFYESKREKVDYIKFSIEQSEKQMAIHT